MTARLFHHGTVYTNCTLNTFIVLNRFIIVLTFRNFAHPETLRPLLLAHGLSPLDLTLFPRPTILPTSLHGWLDTFGFSFCSVLSEDEKLKYKDEVVAVCREKMWDEDKKAWVLDYVRCRISCIKQSEKEK